MKLAKILVVAAVLGSSPLRAQLTPVAGDRREADRAAILSHLDKIFQGFIHQDAEALRAGHSIDWRGFLTGSRTIGKGVDQYMQAVSGALTAPVHMRAYRILDLDVTFYGDVAIVPYICEIDIGGSGQALTQKLRILDVFAKQNGEWIQVATNTGLHPDSQAAQMSQPATLSDQQRKTLLDAREAVWRAYFANDRARLEELLPAETIAIDPGSDTWQKREEILAGAKAFAAGGGRLVRLEFPRTDIQVYGNTAIVYTTFIYELERDGARTTSSGRATEMFVFRDGRRWVNVGWHLDGGK